MEIFPNYEAVADKMFVRISELPVQESIRDIRQSHMNCLIRGPGPPGAVKRPQRFP